MPKPDFIAAQKGRVPVLLGLIGFALVVPRFWIQSAYPARRVDIRRAFEPLATVPLARIQTEGHLTFSVRIPDGAEQDRIRQALGDPGYVIAALGANGSLLCFDALAIDVHGVIDSNAIAFRTVNVPLYGYSTLCENSGLRFTARPGVSVQIRLDFREGNRPPVGDLIVTPYWTSDIKDKLVGLDLDDELRFPSTILAIAGALLLLLAILILLRVPFRLYGPVEKRISE